MEIRDKTVIHPQFGKGTVRGVSDGYIAVSFPDGEKKFIFPDAFERFLAAEDPELRAEINRLLEEKREAARQRERHQPPVSSGTEGKQLPAASKKLRTAWNQKRENIAFKCNYCDGGKSSVQVGYGGVCSDAVIRYNVEKAGRSWCSCEECLCRQYLDGRVKRKDLLAEYAAGGSLCYESVMLRDWVAMAGFVNYGPQKGTPMKLRGGQTNSLCVLTTREPGSGEEERFIFALFLVDDTDEGDDTDAGYVGAHSRFKLKFSPEQAKRMLFWRYHANRNRPADPAWHSGLFRYFDDEEAAQILRDAVQVKTGTPDEALAREFLDYFCRKNRIDVRSVGKPSGVLRKRADLQM